MTASYQIQRLDGYTDGKPSWRRAFVPSPWRLSDRETAEMERDRLQAQNPGSKYRIRKVSK